MKRIKKNIKQIIFYSICAVIGAALGFFGAQYLFENLQLSLGAALLLLALWLLAFFMHIFLHELGHVLFGALTGYHLILFRLGSHLWIKTSAGWSHRREYVAGIGGQAGMVPPETEGEPPYLAYNLGGVLVNFLTSLALIWLGRSLTGDFLPLLCYGSAFIGLLLAVTNILPFKGTDGYNIQRLRRDPLAREQFFQTLSLMAASLEGRSPHELSQLLALNPQEPMDSTFNVSCRSMRAAALIEAHQFDAACTAYAAIWADEAHLFPAQKAQVLLNYLFVLLVTQGDPDLITDLLDHSMYRSYSHRQQADMYRLRSAVAYYFHHDPAEALELLAQGRPLIISAPSLTDEYLERDLYAYLEQVYQMSSSEGIRP